MAQTKSAGDSQGGMEALWKEIDELRQGFYDRVYAASQEFWATKPTGKRLTDWLQEQVWAEREGAKVHAYPVLQMAELMDPETIMMLCHQGGDEAHHCQLLTPCLASRGRTIEGYEPDPVWKAIFQKCYEAADTRDPVTFFALFYVGPHSEGAAAATALAAKEALIGTPDEDIGRAYEKILVDELNHWETGQDALKRYARSAEDMERARDTLRRTAEQLLAGVKRRVVS
jgi:hypothetical protein